MNFTSSAALGRLFDAVRKPRRRRRRPLNIIIPAAAAAARRLSGAVHPPHNHLLRQRRRVWILERGVRTAEAASQPASDGWVLFHKWLVSVVGISSWRKKEHSSSH